MNIQSFKLKTIYLFSILFIGYLPEAFTQADAGEDKTICGQGSVVIGGGDVNPDYCYRWSPQTGLDDPNILHPTASPTVTTTYTLTVAEPDLTYLKPDQIIITVRDATVALNVENNITECMEGRHLTFTAVASDAFPDGIFNPIKFIFHYQHVNGNSYTEEEWSWDRTEYSTIVADQVPTGDNDHKYTTPIFVKVENDNCSATSPTLNIDIYELWIEFVRDNTTKKPWKVVVGENIEYGALASSDCKDWKWEFPDGWPFDKWNPTGGNLKAGNNLVIPYSDLNSANNSDFGDSYGTVRVSCKDGDGNYCTFASSDLVPSVKVEVFYNPDLNKSGGAPTTNNPPCWFVFWKDGNVVEDMNICNYDQTHPDWFGYWTSSTGMVLCPRACMSNGPTETLTNMNGVQFFMTGTGKHLNCVAETITHELHHRDINNAWGGVGAVGPNHNDTDGLPNGEEDAPGQTYFQISDPNNPDTFNYNYPPARTNDYSDNEVRCRIVEINASKATFPNKDWSKDTENPKW